MPKINYFHQIPVQGPERQILFRLGYNTHLTVLNELHRQKLTDGMQRGAALCRLQGAYCRFPISEHGSDYTALADGTIFHSGQLAELLRPCREVVLMAATVGSAIGAAICEVMDTGNATLGVILDAVASETADAGLDWIMQLINQMIAKSGLRMTKYRYSPGYGDLTLSNQRTIYEMLVLEKLQIRLTSEFILIPEKSVLAIAGIEPIR